MIVSVGLTRTLQANRAAHGEWYNAVTRGKVFEATLQAGASLGTALTATAVTLSLYNPSGSGVRLILLQVKVAITTILGGAGTTAYVLAANLDPTAAVPASVTPVTPRNLLLGGGVAVAGLAYSAATLPAAPEVIRVIGSTYYATAAAVAPVSFEDNVNGAVVLPVNTVVTVQGIGQTSSGIVSLMWEEVPYLA